MLKYIGSGMIAVLGLAALASASQAAPGAAGALQADNGQSTAIEKVNYRRCWWHNGVRHCRWVYDDDYGYYDGYGPYYGYGPGIGLYFGGGHGHFGHGHGHIGHR